MASTSSSPRAAPWVAEVPALPGLPHAIVVRNTIRVGRCSSALAAAIVYADKPPRLAAVGVRKLGEDVAVVARACPVVPRRVPGVAPVTAWAQVPTGRGVPESLRLADPLLLIMFAGVEPEKGAEVALLRIAVVET